MLATTKRVCTQNRNPKQKNEQILVTQNGKFNGYYDRQYSNVVVSISACHCYN